MRVSERMRYDITNTRVNNARGHNANTLEKISTLKRINKISDDPVGASQAIRVRDRIGNIGQFKSNVDFSKGYLEKTESALQTISDNLIRAKELAVSLSNGTYNEQARLAASKEVKQILNEIVQSGNTQYADRFVFSGFRTRTPTLSEDGQFLGDDGAVFLQVDDNDFRQVNLQSRYLFEATAGEREAGHFDMYDTVDLLHSGLVDNDVHVLRDAMAELEYQIQKSTSFQASLGSLYGALDSGGRKLEAEIDQNQVNLADIEEVDMFKASSDFHRTESVLQSTLLASNKMLQPSLLNFMQ